MLMSPLILMWKNPRLVARFLVATLLIVIARIPFMSAQLIPWYFDFNPGIALVPLFGAFWGPAGVWAAAAACLLGDSLLEMWTQLTVFRALGYFLCAYGAQCLWSLFAGHRRGQLTDKNSLIIYLSIAGLSCLPPAVWIGIGAELLGLYPFSYFACLTLVHNFVFTVIMGIGFHRLMTAKTLAHVETWWEIMADIATPHEPIRGLLLYWLGCAGAFLMGCLASGYIYNIWPFYPFVLGTTSGIWVRIFVIPLLVVQFIGVICVLRRKACSEEQQPSQHQSFLKSFNTRAYPGLE